MSADPSITLYAVNAGMRMARGFAEKHGKRCPTDSIEFAGVLAVAFQLGQEAGQPAADTIAKSQGSLPSASETPAPRPTCLHDPYHANNTLIVEAHWCAGSRIRCIACGGCAAIGKQGAVVPETCECHSPPKTSDTHSSA